MIVQMQNEVSKRSKEIVSENKMLKKQVPKLKILSIKNQSNSEELEQYGRRLCIRIDGIPAVKKESSDDVIMVFYESII